MDNYKIKVKDEQDFKEVVSLANTLGYGINFSYSNACGEVVKGLLLKSNGLVEWTHRDTYFDLNDSKELTLPQLRDLIVLKRNDVRDANYTYAGNPVLKLETQDYKVWDEAKQAWLEHVGSQTDLRRGLKAIPKRLETATGRFDENGEHHLTFSNGTEEKAPALISGRDAWLANFDGIEVEYRRSTNEKSNWYNFAKEEWTNEELKSGPYEFRLKPQTIKVELEIPAPYKAKIGGRDDTSFVLNVGRHQYCYNNEEDYTKARDALEAVFDAAVRGTNS